VTRVQDLGRALAAAILGALLGAACAVAAYTLAPDLVMKMDTDPPAIVRGLYPVERGPDGVSYAWSRDAVTINLPGLDRQHPWELRLRFRGAREDPATLPWVQISVDGVTLDRRQAANHFQDVAVQLPTEDGPQRGARITIRCSNTFVPGPGDTRQLGIIIDEMRFVRLSRSVMFVPRPALAAATLGGAIFGAFFGLIGLTAGGAAMAVAALACGQAAALVHGAGPYTPAYTDLLPWLAVWIAVIGALLVSIVQRWMGQRLRNTARFAAAFSVAALYLKLVVLLHPTMPIGDALFQAHRFEWVRGGRYLFTSIAPGGYEFPYAIGLYLAALPFASLVHGTLGFMVLLRFVVAIADAAAGVLLYPMITRQTGDRLAGAIAVALFHLVPLNFQVQTVGNLTNAFGQSLFFACVALIVFGWATPRRYVRLTLLTLAALAAMVSHTSTFAIFVPMLVLSSLALWRFTQDDQEDAAAGRALLVVTLIALVAAVALYYGHFGGTYAAQFQRIGGEMGKPAELSDPAGRTIAQRAAAVPYYLNIYYGWPAMALAVIGAVTIARRRDRLTLITWAWLITSGLFLLLGVLTPVDMRYYLAAFPAIALLGGLGASRMWRTGPVAQSIAIVLLAAALVIGVHDWLAPLR
jgi:hypothetical protein